MDFDATYLNNLLKEAQEQATRDFYARCEARRLRRQEFLRCLHEDTLAWEKEFVEWIRTVTLSMATERRRRVLDLPAPWAFSTKYRGGKFRVSTFVTQYRFDPKHFHDAGFTEMPFKRVQNYFAARGITVENVSDPTKGFGFYVRIAF